MCASIDSAANLSDTEWRARRCLVTGASGFIGTALCRRLTSLKADVWGLGRTDKPPYASIRWLSCDVTDQAQVVDAMRTSRPDVVFHLASIVSGARKLDLVLPMLHSNLTAFVNVAVAAAEVSCARIVAAGSLQEPDQELMAVPSSPYAAAKLAASAYARMLANVFGLPIVVARLFMTYGPGQRDLTKLVPHVLSQILAGRRVPMSSGQQKFDWVYVDDVCDALLAIAASPGAVGQIVDVGTGVLTSVLDVARGLAKRLNALEALDVGAIPDRVGDPIRVADIAATKALIGWEPRVGLDEGLDLTSRWFNEQTADTVSSD